MITPALIAVPLLAAEPFPLLFLFYLLMTAFASPVLYRFMYSSY